MEDIVQKSGGEVALPPNWTARKSQRRWPGRTYFYNSLTGECTWLHPLLLQNGGFLGGKCRQCSRSLLHSSGSVPTYSLCLSAVNDNTCACKLLSHTILFIKSLVLTQAQDLVGISPSSSLAQDVPVALRREQGLPTETDSITSLVSCSTNGSAGSDCESMVASDLRRPDSVCGTSVFHTPKSRKEILENAQRSESFDIDVNARTTISVDNYAKRLWQFCRASDSCFILMLVYLVRLIREGSIRISHQNVHKLLLSATVIAAKFFEDAQLSNKSFSMVGGVNCGELNRLEQNMLFLLRWNLNVSEREFNDMIRAVAECSPEQTLNPDAIHPEQREKAAGEKGMELERPATQPQVAAPVAADTAMTMG